MSAIGTKAEFERNDEEIERALFVTREQDVLAALDKPRAVYALQKLLDPGSSKIF